MIVKQNSSHYLPNILANHKETF